MALFEPDIAANTGTIIRMCACFQVAVDVIEPCGFTFSDRSLKRAGMDYLDRAQITRHASWRAFLEQIRGRIVLLTTRAHTTHAQFQFRPDDVLMAGRETAGVPQDVHDAVPARIVIPMAQGARSLNVALAAAIGLGEALRQTRTDWTTTPP